VLFEASMEDIMENLEDIETQLREILPNFDLEFEDLTTSSYEKRNDTRFLAQPPQILNINLRQDSKQIQLNQQISNLDFDQLIQVIQNSEIPENEKEIAKKNIQDLDSELEKSKPDKTKLKKILEWVINFTKKYGISILIPILSKILDYIF